MKKIECELTYLNPECPEDAEPLRAVKEATLTENHNHKVAWATVSVLPGTSATAEWKLPDIQVGGMVVAPGSDAASGRICSNGYNFEDNGRWRTVALNAGSETIRVQFWARLP